MNPKPAFCGGGSGCSTIRDAGLGVLSWGEFSISLPLLGVCAFASLLALSLVRSAQVLTRGFAPLSYAFGIVALGLIGWQLTLGTFCYLCMIVDVAALLSAGCTVMLHRMGWSEVLADEASDSSYADPHDLIARGQSLPGVWREDSQIYEPPNPLVRPLPRQPKRLSRFSWVSLGVLFFAAPFLYPRLVPGSDVPASLQELYDKNRATFVECFDFECPHCRELSPRLESLAEQAEASVVYCYRPLDHHPRARKAAKMAICAAEQGKESELVRQYFRQVDLSDPALLATAHRTVQDPAALDACLASDRPEQRLAKDKQRLDEAGFEGLPTTFIGGVRIVGAHPDVVYLEALRSVRAGEDRQGMSPWAYWVVIVVLFFVVVWSGMVIPAGPLPAQRGREGARKNDR